MTRPLLLLAVVASLLSAGCSVLRIADSGSAPWIRENGPRPATDSESLLMYFEYVRELPAADLAKEHDAVHRLYTNAVSDFVRIRYAMLLCVPGAPSSDDARALEALDPLLKNPDANLHALAFMLSAQIQEQRRGQGLQQKLEALKSLEKSLIERGPGAPRRR